MNTAEPLITIDHFSMVFGKTTVINDLSFTVNKGETFGLLGSNGSGKTTTIRALLGIYQPAAGELLIDGQPYDVGGKTTLGYLPEERGLYKKEKVLDMMVYFGQLKGMTAADAKKEALAYLDRVDLRDKASLRLDKLSGGQQQKIQLGITIMGSPSLLILDEPTKGFDPVNRRLLMNIIEEHQEKGATVIFVTHQMEEVERLCDRIILLKDGGARLYGTVDEVKESYGGEIIEVVSKKQPRTNDSLYTIARKEGSSTFLQPNAPIDTIQQQLLNDGISMTKFELKRPSLDDIFVEIYGEKTANQEKDNA